MRLPTVVEVSWQGGIIVDIDEFPGWTVFGWRVFSPSTNAFGGVPGVIFRDASGRSGDEVYRYCLLRHERVHWLQWATFTALVSAPVYVFGWWPAWTLALTPWVFALLYLIFPPFRRFVEDWADDVQKGCEREARENRRRLDEL